MGDYDDLASETERAILANASLHEETGFTLDDVFTRRIKQFYKEIQFMQGRIIGLIEGNHYGIYSDSGMTTTQKLCEMLKCKYLGVNAFIRLSFHEGHRNASIDIFAHHGRGAARLIGSSLNSVEQMTGVAVADLYCMGHDHQRAVAKGNRLSLAEGGGSVCLKDRTFVLARSGSFLRGYMPGHHSYVAKGAMKPSDLGAVKIIMTPTRERHRLPNRRYDNFTIRLNTEI